MHLPSGVVVDDPARQQRQEAALTWEKNQYPNLSTERRRSLAETSQARAQLRAAMMEAELDVLGVDDGDEPELAPAAATTIAASGNKARAGINSSAKTATNAQPSVTGRRRSLDSGTLPAGTAATRAAATTTTRTAGGASSAVSALRPRLQKVHGKMAQLMASLDGGDEAAVPHLPPAGSGGGGADDSLGMDGSTNSPSLSPEDSDLLPTSARAADSAPAARRGIASHLSKLSVQARVEALVHLYHDAEGNGGSNSTSERKGVRALLYERNPEMMERLDAMRSGQGEGRKLRSLDVDSLLKPQQSMFQQAAKKDARTATRLATAAALSQMTGGGGKAAAPQRKFKYCPVPEEPVPHMTDTITVALAAVHWKRLAQSSETASLAGASICPLPSVAESPADYQPAVGKASKTAAAAAAAVGVQQEGRASRTVTAAMGRESRASNANGTITVAKRRRNSGLRASQIISNFTWSRRLTPEEYLVLAKRRKIGNEPKRDVLTFRAMCDRVDKDGSGDISFEEFVEELESNRSGVKHMRRTLEGM